MVNIIPFTIIKDGELINLNEIVRMVDDKEKTTFYLSNGEILVLTGQAAELLKRDVNFHLQTYYNFKAEVTRSVSIVPASSLVS